MRCVTYLEVVSALAISSLIAAFFTYGLVGSAYALYLIQTSAIFVAAFAASLYIAEVLCKWLGGC